MIVLLTVLLTQITMFFRENLEVFMKKEFCQNGYKFIIIIHNIFYHI